MRLARSINEMIGLLMAITWLLMGENHCKDSNNPLNDYVIWKSKQNLVNKSTEITNTDSYTEQRETVADPLEVRIRERFHLLK